MTWVSLYRLKSFAKIYSAKMIIYKRMTLKDWSTLEGSAQKEALLNEVKGNIFEFLLGSIIARSFNHESEFLGYFSSLDGGKVYQDFCRYQNYLLETDRELYHQLPYLAQEAMNYLSQETRFFNSFSPVHTHLMGKWASSFTAGSNLKESDIVLVDGTGQARGLSLKLCKSGAFVNTKSGGIRSFIEKYFSGFSRASILQQEMNSELEYSFSQMRSACYQWADLSYDPEGTSNTQFDEQWQQKGHPVLPGQLPDELKVILHAHYQRMIGKLHSSLGTLWQEDRALFGQSLLPLVGLSSPEIVQLTCYHKSKSSQRYLLDHFDFFGSNELTKSLLKFNQWPHLKERVASFEIDLGTKILQIRVKPMNTFIVSGLKINCSLKTISQQVE